MVRVRIPKRVKEAAGILKFPIKCRSMVLARTVGNDWLTVTAIMMPVDHMGKTLIRALSSSTCLTVQSFHGSIGCPLKSKSLSGSLIRHALFKNLRG